MSRRLGIAPETVRAWRRRLLEPAWKACTTARALVSLGRSPMRASSG
ncbi:hypothetical protein [Streptomyces virginiae]